jgi:predicted nucleic acid-binding protein
MTRVFIDSSVFFSAANSSRGHSRDLILMAVRGKIDLVLSRLNPFLTHPAGDGFQMIA